MDNHLSVNLILFYVHFVLHGHSLFAMMMIDGMMFALNDTVANTSFMRNAPDVFYFQNVWGRIQYIVQRYFKYRSLL